MNKINKEHFRKLAKEDPYKIPGFVFVGETPINYGLTCFDGKVTSNDKGFDVKSVIKKVNNLYTSNLSGSDGPEAIYFATQKDWDRFIGAGPVNRETEIQTEILRLQKELDALKKAKSKEKDKARKDIKNFIEYMAVGRRENAEYEGFGIFLFMDYEITKFGPPSLVKDSEGAWVIVFEKHKDFN